ncbi:metal dependent phosphohydrolase [Cryptobacterium curtum DSM 15641]|uniref:Ribonuclease Y n=1 Tax=Cryptobacterium curtum (strain ATCC 700683 / DSM 15641 / CCUG 43107 / 12-3) TaxID=469378 RepID=C7MNG2_CRYCD|nr:ribonuclease Y [Cryptobacterium curtum]ACU94452.1 metal dependent phosphohydrolase [Cryptobacterium curtum DSM 15641]
MSEIILIVAIVIAIAAIVAVIVMRQSTQKSQHRSEEEARTLLEDARRQADALRREAEIEAKDEALKLRQSVELEKADRLKEVRAAEDRLNQREKSLDHRSDSLDAREHQLSSMQGQVEKRNRDLQESERELQQRRDNLDEEYEQVNRKLESVAGMTADEAKDELLNNLKDGLAHESAAIIRESEARTKAEADKTAREILSLAIQRVAADHAAEVTVSTIHIPSDELKGRIIGREGRNIRSFEQLTGTNLIIDDTPECVTISCFDPVRREIGRVTMENLVADGRIHPARIEEMFKKAEKLVDQRVQEAGEQAAFDTGMHDLHPELVHTLGRLRYRTSYGQNVLNHSLEVAYIAGVIASELGIDPITAKRAGLLHDIGKAVDHEVEGGHAVIGADLARRFGERPEIVHAIEAHHNDVEPNSVLDVIIQAADAVSAARPGARKETLDAYVKRLEKLEEIANAHKGVERTYAIQAGREVRVMVKPEEVDEAATTVLAHDIAQQIENEMQYPGQVKVVVIRESRAVDIAK